MDDHDGRVALVTGGSSGIGRATAFELAMRGSAVVIHGLGENDAESVASMIREQGGKAIATSGSIEQIGTSETAVEVTMEAFGRLDTLVTCAGVQRYGDVVSTPSSTWDEVLDINVKGVFLAAKCALPEIRRSSAGSMVVVSSVQATATQPQVAAYTASKGALLSLVRSMAVDEALYGVRVNSVSPGSVDTPMLRASAALFGDGSEAGVEDLLTSWGTAHALGRVATPDEVASVISFLASPRASFVTGEDIRVDGGLVARLAAPLSRGEQPEIED